MTKINSKKAFNWLRNISSGKFNTNSDVNLKFIIFNISLYTSHFIGLLLVIQFPCGLAPLLATGNSSTVPKLFRRYLSTLVHTRKFYESDPFIRGSTSWKLCNKLEGEKLFYQIIIKSFLYQLLGCTKTLAIWWTQSTVINLVIKKEFGWINMVINNCIFSNESSKAKIFRPEFLVFRIFIKHFEFEFY